MTDAEHERLQAFLDHADLPGALQYLVSRDVETHGRPFIHYHIGFVHRLMNNFAEAVRSYEKAIELDPDVPSFHLGLGIAFQQQGDFESAVVALNRAIELDPLFANAWNSLGLTYKMRGDLAGALKTYRRAQEIVLEAAWDWANAEGSGPTMVRLNETGEKGLLLTHECFAAVKSRLRSDLMYAVVVNNIGGCYLELGDAAAARSAFLESIEFIPDAEEYEPPFIGLRRLERAT